MNLDRVAGILGLPPTGINEEIKVLLTDSRDLEEADGTLFFAIETATNDGHRFISDLYRQGVRNFVVTRIPAEMKDARDARFLVVPDVIEALQKIGTRNSGSPAYILAVTGSRGKTTLKEWIFQLLEPLGEITRSPRSYNSQIGVPLSMWSLDGESLLGVIEAGISRRGEMERLRRCINPDAVIITNIGNAHAEGFGSDQEKACEKVSLAAGPSTSTIIYNADDSLIDKAVAQLCPEKNKLRWSYTRPDAELPLRKGGRSGNMAVIDYEWKGETHRILAPFDNEADYENGANALAFMLLRGVKPDMIAERFLHLHKIGTRLNVTEGVNGCMLIHDSYTSDFTSLRPALHFARRRRPEGQGLTLILSDLHHEGRDLSEMYANISRLVSAAGVTRFIGIGPVTAAHASVFSVPAEFYPDVDSFLQRRSASDFYDETILLKGGPEMNFTRIAEMLEARSHETVLEVNLDAIVDNYNYFRSKVPSETGMICMVKASGYGAGSYEIARTLQDCGAAYIAVAVLDEGMELRRRGISMPIMVMNPRVANYKAMFAARLEPEIYNPAMLTDVIREAGKNGVKDYPIHIKLDTGMHRMGFIEEELPMLMDMLESTENVRAASVFTHLATADCPDMDDYTYLQLDRFARWSDYMMERSRRPILRHVLNSAGILRFPEYHYDLVRLGIGLYGANTLPPEMEKPLATVSTLRTVIISLREWKAGETIGYGRRGVLKRDSRIATIPIGYADGMNRHFGNGVISLKVKGKDAPTVGNICMDACMIDVTEIDCKVGDEVEIFGASAPLSRLSDALSTIPYEILTSVSPRVKRVYYRE